MGSLTDAPKRPRGRPKKIRTEEVREVASEPREETGEGAQAGPGMVPDTQEDEARSGSPEESRGFSPTVNTRVRAAEAAPSNEPKPDRMVRSSIGNHEIAAIAQEAWEAYDMQDVRVRFDTNGHRWWFGVIIDTGRAEMKLERSTPVGDFTCRFISTVDLGRDDARQQVEDAVRAMA